MRNTPLTIGLFGYGCVGQGFYKLATSDPELRIHIKKICIRDTNKQRDIPASLFTDRPESILSDPDIDVIVELISDAEAAFHIVKTGLIAGKAVVSANKKMLALHLEELVQLQEIHRVPLLYEGAVCGSIPIIRNLENYYDKEPVHAIEGILNGSTNYILTQLANGGSTLESALRKAQELGFAEADPTLDVEGFDPAFKLCILLLHSFGIFVQPAQVHHLGISRISAYDLAYAAQRKARIKLIARAVRHEQDVQAFVLPHLVNGNSSLTYIDHETNSVVICAEWSETQHLTGKGAGSIPTGSAVLSDVTALQSNYRYPYRKAKNSSVKPVLTSGIPIRIYAGTVNGAVVDTADFNVIEEQYTGNGHAYTVGTITPNNLFKATWLKDPGVSVIAL